MKKASWVLALVIGAAVGVGLTRLIVPVHEPRPLPAPVRAAGDAAPAPAPPSRGPEDTAAVYRVPLEDSPVKGPADALVTVVVVSDFQCPFCKRVLPTLAQLEQAYRGKIRFAFKHQPLGFHERAIPAALAAEEARAQGGDAKFWEMHDALFASSPELDRGALERAAQAVGLDLDAFRRSLDDQRHLARVKRDQALATSLGATGTPTFFVNGRKLVGAQPYEAFRALVDEELAKAEALVKRGVAPADVYARTIAQGSTAPVYLPAGARPPQELPRPPSQAAKVPLRADDPARGPADAKVTIVVFSEFQCPFCARLEPTLARIQETWPSTRVVWKHQPLPFHPNALPAALAAEAARAQGKFWPLHDRMFAGQATLAPAQIEGWAREVGLDMARFQRDAASPAARARVEEDQRLGAEVGAQGTPTLFLNCRKVVGALPFEAFKPVVEEELAKADAAIAAGAKPGPALYERLCADNVRTLAAAAPPAPPPSAAPAPPPIDAREIARAVRADDPARGSARAPVTVLVFSDFQCPFCSRAVPTLKEIEDRYRDHVRIVWKHQPLPFHQNALPAALAAEAAREQGKFWQMHDKLFENQRDLSDAALERIAGEVGLDLGRFRAAVHDDRLRARIAEDQALAQRLGASGTPTFIVGGERVVGAQPFEAFRAVIERQLAAARAR